jgi:hypothetical protein
MDGVIQGQPILECTVLGIDLLLKLSAKATGFFATQALRIIHRLRTGKRRDVWAVEGNFRFRIDDADGDRIVMCTHAVHSEGNQCKILVAPIERSVEMTLCSETAIVSTSHIVQEMQCYESRKGDAILGLAANTVNMVRNTAYPCEFIGKIIVLF